MLLHIGNADATNLSDARACFEQRLLVERFQLLGLDGREVEAVQLEFCPKMALLGDDGEANLTAAIDEPQIGLHAFCRHCDVRLEPVEQGMAFSFELTRLDVVDETVLLFAPFTGDGA